MFSLCKRPCERTQQWWSFASRCSKLLWPRLVGIQATGKVLTAFLANSRVLTFEAS